MMTSPDSRPVLCIVVVDDELREFLVSLLTREPIDTVACPNAEACINRPADRRPTCALIDLHLKSPDGLEVLRRVAARGYPLPVIALIPHGDARGAVSAVKAGAMDFIETPVDRPMLMEVLDAAFASSRRRTSSGEDRAAFAARLARLTEREHEVFDGMVSGKPNKVIARDLAISPRTVEIHRARVMHKLEAHSMAELVRCATRAAIADEDST